MSNYFIAPYPKNHIPTKHADIGNDYLDISEGFYNTIQGEGPTFGRPSIFLRVQGCTLNCVWCDTDWQKGFRFSFEELFLIMEKHNLIDQLMIEGRHLILTGGSPLKQQDRLVNFFAEFAHRYQFMPYIEVENECTIIPTKEFDGIVTQWNNSPKLANSNMAERVRFRPEVLAWFRKNRADANFKFVISTEGDIKEIQQLFVLGEVAPHQIILMPEGDTAEKIEAKRKWVLEICMKYGWRYSTREQIFLDVL